jgi:hypothetical protein
MGGGMNLSARIAIEALRAGVPNCEAVRLLGTEQTDIEQSFEAALQRAWADGARPATGLGIAGDFGAGKSHLLGYLAEAALAAGFVVSRVVVSKETSLSDPARLFQAAMLEAVLPGRNDDPMKAALAELRRNPADLSLLQAAVSDRDSGFAPVFAAVLFLLGRPATPPERIRRFEKFLAGGRLAQVDLKQALKEAGAARMFDLRAVPVAQLAVQRALFAPLLFRRAGFAGWCLLLDEVELIGRYTPLQRASAYAELARWLGLDASVRVPGLVSVYAITEDFRTEVIDARGDAEKLPDRLRLKGRAAQAALTLAGIRHISSAARRLLPPRDADLAACHDRLRELYKAAYGWDAPPAPLVTRTAAGTMRQYIKSWITSWDLLRLEGAVAEIVTGTLGMNYGESADFTPVAEGEDET